MKRVGPLIFSLAVLLAPLFAASGDAAAPSGTGEFAADLYGRLADKEKGNFFLSPYSISSALAMTWAGAAGRTGVEMAQVLRFGGKGEEVHADFARMSGELNVLGRSGGVKLSIANALWAQKGLSLKSEFLGLTRRNYGAGLNELDLKNDPEGSRRTINRWVEDKTERKIKDLIPRGALGEGLVLTNAVYFKGLWERQFKKEDTQDGTFFPGVGRQVSVPLMHQIRDFGYFETPDLQGLELAYKGRALSLAILLPKKTDGLPLLEKSLTAQALNGWLSHLREREVAVYIPRFKLTSTFSLADTLGDMGMSSAFIPCGRPEPACADFSGMDGLRDLYISAVLHKAFVEVNEEGTEAAAATAVVMRLTATPLRAEPPVFRADHPFIFLIRHRSSGAILFMGRLADPSAKGQ